MAKLFEGNVTLKNGVEYDVDYTVSASYTGTLNALLNGGTGLDGSVTFKVKSPTYAWTKSVTIGITFGDDDSNKRYVSISLEKDDYTTHTASISVTPSITHYGSLKFWIKNNASNDEPLTLIKYHGTGLSYKDNGITNLHAGGLCGIYPSTSSPSFELIGNFFAQEELPGGDLEEEGIYLNYYWGSPTFKATITHSNGYEKSTPSYAIKYRSYRADGTLRWQYLSGKEYSWKIDKNNDYIETIVDSLPLFLREGSEELNYPIREYFLYYNGLWKSEPIYVTPFSFNFPNTIIAKQLTSDTYEAEIDLGNLNKWIDLNYSNLTFKAQNKTGEITKINNILIGKVSTLTEVDSNLSTYEIYRGDIPIISKEINTIFGLDFSVNNLSYTKSYDSDDFFTLQRGEEMNLSAVITENSGSLLNEEVEITLIVRNIVGQEKEIYSIEENWEKGKSKNITFGNITINELIEINSEKTNDFYLKIASGGTEKIVDLNKKIYAYDYIESIVLNDQIKYELVSGQDKVNGLCHIKSSSTLEIAFPQEQFKDNLSIKIIFNNDSNNSYTFNASDFQNEISYDVLKQLLNDSSTQPIEITPTQKNTKEISYEIQYSYDSSYHPISTEEILVITIPPLLVPTLAYRSKQVGINCEPSEESVLDIKAEGGFTKVRFQDTQGEETGYIDLENGGLKGPGNEDFYLTQTAADNIYLKQEEYKQKIIDNTSNIETNTSNIETNTSNISAIVEALQNYSISVQGPKESTEYNTYKAFGDSGVTKSVIGSFTFEGIPTGSKCKAIIETVYQSGSKDDYKDGTTVSITSEVVSGTSCTVNYKANYIERISPTNRSYFTVRAYLFISTISISS